MIPGKGLRNIKVKHLIKRMVVSFNILPVSFDIIFSILLASCYTIIPWMQYIIVCPSIIRKQREN